MNINDFLMKYRKPVFQAEGGDGAPAPAAGDTPAAGDAAPAVEGGALSGDAPAAGEGDPPAENGDAPAANAAEFSLAAPEGMESFQGEFDTFAGEAKEWMAANPDATPADAFKWAAERQAAAAAQSADGYKAHIEAENTQISEWNDALKADKVLGGDAYGANMAQAQKAIDSFGDDNLKQLINNTSLGSNPGFVRMAFEAGKAVADAPVVKANGGSPKLSLTESLYGKKS